MGAWTPKRKNKIGRLEIAGFESYGKNMIAGTECMVISVGVTEEPKMNHFTIAGRGPTRHQRGEAEAGASSELYVHM